MSMTTDYFILVRSEILSGLRVIYAGDCEKGTHYWVQPWMNYDCLVKVYPCEQSAQVDLDKLQPLYPHHHLYVDHLDNM